MFDVFPNELDFESKESHKFSLLTNLAILPWHPPLISAEGVVEVEEDLEVDKLGDVGCLGEIMPPYIGLCIKTIHEEIVNKGLNFNVHRNRFVIAMVIRTLLNGTVGVFELFGSPGYTPMLPKSPTSVFSMK